MNMSELIKNRENIINNINFYNSDKSENYRINRAYLLIMFGNYRRYKRKKQNASIHSRELLNKVFNLNLCLDIDYILTNNEFNQVIKLLADLLNIPYKISASELKYLINNSWIIT